MGGETLLKVVSPQLLPPPLPVVVSPGPTPHPTTVPAVGEESAALRWYAFRDSLKALFRRC